MGMVAIGDPSEGSTSEGYALLEASSVAEGSTSEGHALLGASSWIRVTNGAPIKEKLDNKSAEISGPMYFACPGPEEKPRVNERSVRFTDEDAEIYYVERGIESSFKQVGQHRLLPARPVQEHSGYKSQLATIAAIQRAVDLAEGNSMTYDPETWEAEDVYEGTVKKPWLTNDNRRTPILWSKRHCRMYVDPWKDGAPGAGSGTVAPFFEGVYSRC